MYLKSFPFLLVKTTIPFYSTTNANIAKGERKGKPKSHFRLGYAELHLILVANAANIEKSSWRKKSSVSFFSFNTNSIILLCYRKKLWEAILYPTQLTAFDTIIANQYSYPIAFTPGYEHTKWTDKKSKPARFVFLPPYIIFAETARKNGKTESICELLAVNTDADASTSLRI